MAVQYINVNMCKKIQVHLQQKSTHDSFFKKTTMKLKLLSVAILVGLLCCCTFSEKEREAHESSIIRIPDNEKAIKASELFHKMEIIKLETTSDCLIDQVIKIEFSNDFILIQDNQNHGVYLFDYEGKFFRNINYQGRGPGEYNSFDDFLIDYQANTLEVLDKTSAKIYIYDLSTFEFLETIPLPITFAFKFFKKDNLYYFQTNGSRNVIDGKPTNSDIIAYNAITQKVWPLFNRIKDDSHNQFLEFVNIFYTNSNDEIFASLSWDQMIYRLLNDTIISFYGFDPGERGIPAYILEGPSEDKLAYVFSEEGQKKIGGFRLLMHENGLSIFGFGKGASTKPYYYFLFDNDNKSFSTNQIINDLGLIPLPDIDIFKITKETVVSLIYPAEIIGSEFFNDYNLSENDNPILINLQLIDY